MPTIRTGNQEWDQNLNTLGSALFPDPSKAAHAYYYGSEARKAQLESVRLQNQMAAQNAQLGMQWGRNLPPGGPTYQPGFGGAAVMNDPSFAIPAAPGPTAPPAAPGQPVPPVQALPTLGAAMTTMQPQAQASAIVAGVENNASSGPGPEPTGSNGSVPQNGPGTFQPGSVTSAGGGGVVMAPPGAPDGTPAPASVNMGQMIALGIAAGQTPDQAYATARGTLGNMVKNGQIALPLAEQMAAFYGAPQMRVQAQHNEGALAVGAQTQAGENVRNAATNAAAMARQQLVTSEARRADQEAPEKTVDANGNPIFIFRKDTVGKPSYDSTVANTRQTQLGAPGQYVQPGGAVTTATAGTAVAQGLPAAATSSDQQTAIARQRIMAEPDPKARERLIQQQIALATTPKEIDPAKQAQQQGADYREAQRIYSVPQKPLVSLGVKDPVAFDGDAEVAINQRAYELGLDPNNRYMTADPSKARAAAIHDLQKNPTAAGLRLPTPAEVNQQRIPARSKITTAGTSGDPRIDTYLDPYNKTGTGTDHMMIRLVPQNYGPTTAVPGATSAAPATPAVEPPVSTVVVPGSSAAQSPQQMYGGVVPGATPSPGLGGRIVQGAQAVGQAGRATNPAPMSPAQIYGSQPAVPGAAPAVASGGAPPGALGPAAPGAVEGAPVYGPGGAVGVNRGGWVYPR